MMGGLGIGPCQLGRKCLRKDLWTGVRLLTPLRSESELEDI